ncbi:MAG: RNA polymerase sigma factor [Saprospiraceae bacterium]|nr:RNA polymerase sigma factor [Saprospiraceae bacterium]
MQNPTATTEPKEKETQLFLGCKAQDRRSQRAIYERYYGYVKYVAYLYVSNEEDASEILNEVFFKVFKNIDRYDINKAFKPWLRRITINTALNVCRSKQSRGHSVELQPYHDSSTTNVGETSVYYDEILALLANLPKKYAQVFRMFAIEGFSHKEIAEQLNIKLGTSKSCFHRARNLMKEQLAAC